MHIASYFDSSLAPRWEHVTTQLDYITQYPQKSQIWPCDYTARLHYPVSPEARCGHESTQENYITQLPQQLPGSKF